MSLMKWAVRALRSAASLIRAGEWNEPANYGSGFDSCLADNGLPPGLYPPPGSSSSTTSFAGWSTFAQGQATTPTAHPAPKSSSCTTYSKPVRSASPALADHQTYTTYATAKPSSSSSSSKPVSSTKKPATATQKPSTTKKTTVRCSSPIAR